MPVTRTTLLSGPAAATFNGHTFFARDGILVTPALELEAVDSDAQGVLDATATYAPVTIKFTPSAPFADLIALYPYAMGTPGMSLFGSADTPLVLVAANGVRLTFYAVAIIQMPDLTLSANDTAAGAVTFLALGARSLPITAANRLVTIDTAEFPALPTTPPQLADDFEIPGTGTITASGHGISGTNPSALFNLQVNLFYPEFFAPDPVVQYDGMWWPAMSVSCAVTNTVTLTSGGSLSIGYDCTTFDPSSTTEIGSFSFFGVSVPVYCAGLAPRSGSEPAETRTFSGSLTVANEWP